MSGGIFEASICVSYSVVPEVYTSSGKFFFILGNCYWQRIVHLGLELWFGLLSCKPPWFSSWHCYKPWNSVVMIVAGHRWNSTVLSTQCVPSPRLLASGCSCCWNYHPRKLLKGMYTSMWVRNLVQASLDVSNQSQLSGLSRCGVASHSVSGREKFCCANMFPFISCFLVGVTFLKYYIGRPIGPMNSAICVHVASWLLLTSSSGTCSFEVRNKAG